MTRDLSLTAGLDEKYTYDDLNRLTNTERGTLDGNDDITSLVFEQDWTLDELGNWDEFDQDDDGTGGWDLEQDRTTNNANEIRLSGGSIRILSERRLVLVWRLYRVDVNGGRSLSDAMMVVLLAVDPLGCGG